MSNPSLDVQNIASLARIELSAQEKELFAGQLGQIVSYVEKLREADISSVPDHPIDPHLPTNVLREDAALPSLDRELALLNAPLLNSQMIQVPKIIE